MSKLRLLNVGSSSFLIAIAWLFFSIPAYAYQFTVTDLGQVIGYSINNNGVVAGTYEDTGHKTFIWENGNFQYLGGIPGHAGNQQPYVINDNGQILVTIQNGSAHIWENGVFSSVGALPNDGHSFGTEGFGMNNLGQVVGQSWTGQPDGYHAFLYSGSISDICVNGTAGLGRSINISGQVVGEGCGYGSFMWEDGGYTDLGNFIGEDINDHSQIAGRLSEIVRPALWENGSITKLDDVFGWSLAINNLGQVVGEFSDPLSSENQGFLWDSDNGLIRLLDLIDPALDIRLLKSVDINDSGQIVANGYVNGSSVLHSFLLSPTAIPIPPAIWLFGTGLIGLIGIAKKKSNV